MRELGVRLRTDADDVSALRARFASRQIEPQNLEFAEWRRTAADGDQLERRVGWAVCVAVWPESAIFGARPKMAGPGEDRSATRA